MHSRDFFRVVTIAAGLVLGKHSRFVHPEGFAEHWVVSVKVAVGIEDLLGRRLDELTAISAMESSRAPQRAIMRTVMFGTTVKATRVMHAAMTKMPEERSTKTMMRFRSGMRSVQSSGTGMARRNASVTALKQLSAMKKCEDAVQLLSGSGWTLNLRENGKHMRLSIRVVAMKPQMQRNTVKLSSVFCHAPNARRRYKMITIALRLNTCRPQKREVSFDLSREQGIFLFLSLNPASLILPAVAPRISSVQVECGTYHYDAAFCKQVYFR